MLERIFIEVLNMSLTGSIAILTVLTFRLLLSRFPRIFSYALWAVVLFRLLCPVSFPAPMSLVGALADSAVSQGRMEYIPPDIGFQTKPLNLPFSPFNQAVQNSLPIPNPTGSVNPLQVYLYIGEMLWLLGIGILFCHSMFSLHRLKKELKTATPLHGFQKTFLYQADHLASPFVYGIFCPAIYLPAGLEENESAHILLHENIHIQRGDHIFRLLAYIALCIHWFNPLVWAAFYLSGQDMEMSCDETVIRKMGNQVKQEYSKSLLSFAAGKPSTQRIPIAFGEGNPKSRIRNVLRYRKPSVLLTGGLAIVCGLLTITLLTNPDKDTSDTNRKNVFYGIVGYGDVESTSLPLVVKIPGYGDMAIPEANEIYPYIEIDFDGLKVGDLVQIVFPDNEEILIMESYPAQFSHIADSIAVMGRGPFAIDFLSSGRYDFTIPLGMADGAQPGDTLEIYHHAPEIDGQETKLLASVQVKEVVKENEQIWVEMSKDEVETFLSEFGFGISCVLVGRGTGEL